MNNLTENKNNTDQAIPTSVLPLITGPLLLLFTYIVDAPGGMKEEAWHIAGMGLWMAIWWAFEVVPIAVTALLPMLAAPIMGIVSIKTATSAYAHPLIYLFLGGFMLGLAMEKWQLHKRIALNTLLIVGENPVRQVAGFMVATAFLSMWVSNTATTIMMLPIGLSVLSLAKEQGGDYKKLATPLLLGIAYSASLGGIATLIGTPPNALLAAFLEDSYNIELGFAKWMSIGLPVSIVMILITWAWLTRNIRSVSLFGEGQVKDLLQSRLAEMGKFSQQEKRVGIVFFITALLWMFRPMLNKWLPDSVMLSDTGIAIAAALSLFIIPADRKKGTCLMSWEDTKKLPWGVLLLFGGGLSLASMIKSSGLASWIASALEIVSGYPILLVILVLVVVLIFLTELTSNTATTAAFLPVVGVLAVSQGLDPVLLAIPTAIAASCAFMMPVATPPNAIIFSSGEITIRQMMREGMVLNFVGIIVVTLMGYGLVSWVMIG